MQVKQQCSQDQIWQPSVSAGLNTDRHMHVTGHEDLFGTASRCSIRSGTVNEALWAHLLQSSVNAAVEERQRGEDRRVEVRQPLPHLRLHVSWLLSKDKRHCFTTSSQLTCIAPMCTGSCCPPLVWMANSLDSVWPSKYGTQLDVNSVIGTSTCRPTSVCNRIPCGCSKQVLAGLAQIFTKLCDSSSCMQAHACDGVYLRGGLLAPDLVGAPGALDLTADALQGLDLLVGRHTLVVQVVHLRADARVLLQQRLPQRLQAAMT